MGYRSGLGDQVLVARKVQEARGVAKRWDMIDGSKGDIAFAGLEERFDGRPGRRG